MPISKKIRFEVLKRDSFTCQYCGASAPSVILEVDHIDPVSKGGSDDIMNLVTACRDCNQGKKARELSDDTVISKRKKQLDIQQDKLEQIEMMAEWHKSLLEQEKNEFKIFQNLWHEYNLRSSVNDEMSPIFAKWRNKYSFDEIIESMKKSLQTYDDGTNEGLEKAFHGIPKILGMKSVLQEKPYLQDLFYIRGIIRNRFNYCDDRLALQLLENHYLVYKNLKVLKDIATQSRNWTEWKSTMRSFFGGKNG